MDRLLLLAPALLMLAVMSIGLVVFAAMTVTGRAPKLRGVKHNELFGPFFGAYLVWLMRPLERALVGRVSANAITAVSLIGCAIAGLAAGTGHLAAATWVYGMSGMFDALDGRLARSTGDQTEAGALFDSVSDRWGELFVFSGYIWLLHDSPWMLAAVAAIGASQMVSYTRARAEGLGLNLRGGAMQRAERVVLTCVGTLIAAWYATEPTTAYVVEPLLGTVMVVLALASTATAVSRWIQAYRALQLRARPAAKASVAEAAVTSAASPSSTGPQLPAFPVPQKLRESAELAPAAPRL